MRDCGMKRKTSPRPIAWFVSITTAALMPAFGQEPIDPSKRDHYGEYYDLAKYQDCKRKVDRRDTQCEYLILKRHEQPEYWPYLDVPKPKLPEAPNPPVYKQGMSAKEYFQALCKAEAGEFIYKTAENVEGIYQIRPRKRAISEELRDRYIMEDPYGYTESEHENPAFIYTGPGKYQFLEVPVRGERKRFPEYDRKYYHESIFVVAQPGDRIARFFDNDGRTFKSLKKEYGANLKAQYGYTWREIKRPRDREHTIVGGELILLDLRTNEILGIRRGFIRSGNVRNVRSGIQWEIGEVCPVLTDRPGWAKDADFSYWFIAKVLRPISANKGGKDATKR